MDAAVDDAVRLGHEGGTTGDTSESEEHTVDRPRQGWRLLTLLLVAVNVPIVVAAVRGLAEGWQPMGDNGILLVRARDVGTAHHPLLGTWTSASVLYEANFNNPGPLYFDALALPIRVLGPWVGLAVGVMIVNMASSSFAVVVGRRLGGTEAMVAIALVVVATQFAMGSELLYDVWQPNALVLPFLAFMVAAAALASGDVRLAPWVMGIGSLVVQTHFSHAVLVGVLMLVATALCVRAVRRSDAPVALRRPLIWTAVVAVLAWSQPLIEQFTGAGDGNLSRIVDAAGSEGGPTPIGWDRAPRLMAEIMVRGPWFTRDAYGKAIPPITAEGQAYGTVTFGPAVAVLVALTAALIAVGVWGARTGRRGVSFLAWIGLAAMAAALVALATAPVNTIGISLHQMRWLWPIAALITATLVMALISLVRSRPRARGVLLGAGCAVSLIVAGANLPTFTSASHGPTESPDLLDDGRELVGQLDALEGRGTVLYDPRTLLFGEPFSGMTFAEMQDRGIRFVFDDEGFIRQFGEGRRDDGTADLRLWQVQGADAEEPPPGAERVAYVETEFGPVALLVRPLD